MSLYEAAKNGLRDSILKYEIQEEDKSVVLHGVMQSGEPIDTKVVFDSRGYFSIRWVDMVKVPAGKEALIMELCNTMNRKYAKYKFVFYPQSMSVTMSSDCMADEHNVLNYITRLHLEMVLFGGIVYGEFMRALWM